MYMDTIVIAGVGTVLLMIAFMVGLGYVFMKEGKRREKH